MNPVGKSFKRKIQVDSKGPFIKHNGKIFRENLEPNYGHYAEHDYKIGDTVYVGDRGPVDINVWEDHPMSEERAAIFGDDIQPGHMEAISYRWSCE